MMNFTKDDVFISYKYHGANNEVLPDYYMAKTLNEELAKHNVNSFFCSKSILEEGCADYKRLIDSKLDEASILIVVTTSPNHCDSNWVRYEWDSFYNDLLSNRKKGQLISYVDGGGISEYPRTIRINQIFEKSDLDSLIKFVLRYLEKIPRPIRENNSKGSAYNYTVGNEQQRLKIQARVECEKDYDIIKPWLDDDSREYFVLDVGCSMGTVTKNVFGNFSDNVKVLGVDKFQVCIDEFNSSIDCPNMFAELLNFEDDDWKNQLSDIMKKHGIPAFDLVYCSLSLHHMSNSGLVIKGLWDYIANGGRIFIRTCDDALKLAYPDSGLMDEIIKMTAGVSKVSDRFHGRKVYQQLSKAKFENITIDSFAVDTVNKSVTDRYTLYMTTFDWRKNYFKQCVQKASEDKEIERALAEYNKIITLLDKIEDLFSNYSFYFCYYVTIAYAEKASIYLD